VVDPVQLRFVKVLVHLRGERPCGFEVVAERLLHDHARGAALARPATTRPNRKGGISR
jgi:hypothetical protein